MKAFIFALPFLNTIPLISASPNHPTPPTNDDPPAKHSLAHYYNSPNEAFQDLLDALPEDSLHAALVSSLSHFRDGVFESDRHGVEHIHQDNPPLATKLLVAAVKDLRNKKRQANNGTTSSSTPSQSSPSSTNTPSAVLVPVVIPTTDSQGRSTTTSQDVLSAPTASVAVTLTSVNAQGQTTLATTTKPAVVYSTTDASGSPVLSTPAVNFAPSSGQVITSTNAQGSPVVTTYTPSAGRVSSIVLQTTTGRDGKATVVTSYTYVEPASATGGTVGTSSKTSTAKPGLQSAGAEGSRRGLLSGGGAAVVGGVWAGVFAFV